MTKQRTITIVSRRNNVVGRLTAHDIATGVSCYQVDGPYQGRYHVLGLRSEHPALPSNYRSATLPGPSLGALVRLADVDSLAHARETMRLDAARLGRSSR